MIYHNKIDKLETIKELIRLEKETQNKQTRRETKKTRILWCKRRAIWYLNKIINTNNEKSLALGKQTLKSLNLQSQQP